MQILLFAHPILLSTDANYVRARGMKFSKKDPKERVKAEFQTLTMSMFLDNLRNVLFNVSGLWFTSLCLSISLCLCLSMGLCLTALLQAHFHPILHQLHSFYRTIIVN